LRLQCVERCNCKLTWLSCICSTCMYCMACCMVPGALLPKKA
jgi:hypothetical protein